MDGFMLAERIGSDSAHLGAVLLMLSSAGQRGDADRSRALGLAGYLTKPITQAELWQALQVSLGAVRTGVPAPFVTRHTIREGIRRLRVLLAEDNPVNQLLAVRTLERQGHTVVTVQTGAAAMSALEREVFDLILMDVQMPEMDGFEATVAIRRLEREVSSGERVPRPGSSFAASPRHHLPIIALTAHAMAGDEARCLAAGMDAYLSKPIKPTELVAAITRLVPEPTAGSQENR
jgi:CheY-like chemotaxis protein